MTKAGAHRRTIRIVGNHHNRDTPVGHKDRVVPAAKQFGSQDNSTLGRPIQGRDSYFFLSMKKFNINTTFMNMKIVNLPFVKWCKTNPCHVMHDIFEYLFDWEGPTVRCAPPTAPREGLRAEMSGRQSGVGEERGTSHQQENCRSHRNDAKSPADTGSRGWQ